MTSRTDVPVEESAANVTGARRRGALSTRRVVFLVIAAAAPMAAMVGNVPLAIVDGNGVGLPAAFLIASLVLMCFSVGYAAMSRRVVNTGAFYTYIARALGKPAGVASAYVAVLAYIALTCGLVGAFGYFTALVLAGLGVTVPWYVFSIVGLIFVGVMGYRSAELSAKVLGALMILEFGVLIVFDILVIAHNGAAAFPAASFAPSNVTSGSLGIALMFAFFSFVGFESAALYGEETADPERSIPRATYIAVASIGIFYVLTTWLIIGGAGTSTVVAQAREQKGLFVFNLIQQYGGELLYDVSAVLLCTSVLAGLQALHNASSRYLFALGREKVLPSRLGDYHPQHLSPHIASIVVTVIASIVTAIFIIGGWDPYVVMAATLIGVGTLGIIALQATASLAVVTFFWRRGDRDLWRCVIAPMIGFVGLTTAFFMALSHYPVLTGSTDPLINSTPIVLFAVAFAGVVMALQLRRRNPATYAALAQSQRRGRRTAPVPAQHITYSRTYCLVGAGPAGLVMARAMIAEGVRFDWYERHTDVGGIWDMENLGGPMYQSAHFISSKYTSGFVGYPMPADYPDYPSWEQIRDYIRSFAHEFGLYDHVQLGVAVVSAEPSADDQWIVTLSNGQTKTYDGVIAAPGVTWCPAQPALEGASNYSGEIRHSVTYSASSEFSGKRALIVGAGNSGVDIACDAARSADQAYLSVRRGYRFLPKHIFGLPTDALLGGVIEPPKGISISGDPQQLIDSLVGDLTRLGLPAPDHDLLTSHPIMNTQVLHYLAHGDLIAKPDIARLTHDGVDFVDGSHETIDLIVLATGYEYQIPFIDPRHLVWQNGHPQLYLNVFSREHDSLYVLGFVEFAGAAYTRFDEMSQLVIMDIRARETGQHRDEWRALKISDQPDLRGGVSYVDSPRHTNYVDMRSYTDYLADLRDRFEWADLDQQTFEGLRRTS